MLNGEDKGSESERGFLIKRNVTKSANAPKHRT